MQNHMPRTGGDWEETNYQDFVSAVRRDDEKEEKRERQKASSSTADKPKQKAKPKK